MNAFFVLVGRHIRRHPGMFALLISLSLFVAALWVIEPLYSSYAVDQLLSLSTGGTPDLVLLASAWIGIFVALAIGDAVQKYVQWKYEMMMELETVEDSYEHLLRLPMAFHNTQKTGEAMKTISDGADQLAYQLHRNALNLTMSLGAAITFLITSFMIEWRLAIILVIVLSAYVSIVTWMTIKTASLQDLANKLWVKPSGRQFDAVMNVSSVKSGAQEQRELEIVEKLHDEGLATQLKINKRWALLEALNFFMLTRILLVAIGVLLMVHGDLTLGGLYFFQFSFYRVLTPFEMLSGIMPQWRRAIGKVKMMRTLVGEAPEPGMRKKGVVPDMLDGGIRFENVSFSYRATEHTSDISDDEKTRTPALEKEPTDDALPPHDERHSADPTMGTVQDAPPMQATIDALTMDIKPGEHVALVGHSGAGKSTIASLLNRFYDVTGGRILIDGTDLNDLDVRWWRSQIGLVLQENLMFNDTVLENIRYARPTATLDEVKLAAKRASADEYIERLPKKYDTEIGERGVKLSGGERQRLAIARAILKDPKIVILDEATSALDSLTERKVQDGIKELIAGRTAVIIAHRLSTVRSADRIAILEDGKLMAMAPHDELLKTNDVYRQMVELQQGGVLPE